MSEWESEWGVVARVEAEAHSVCARVVCVLHQLLQHGRALGVVAQDAADRGGEVYLRAEVYSEGWHVSE